MLAAPQRRNPHTVTEDCYSFLPRLAASDEPGDGPIEHAAAALDTAALMAVRGGKDEVAALLLAVDGWLSVKRSQL
jgi:hypothetical protein